MDDNEYFVQLDLKSELERYHLKESLHATAFSTCDIVRFKSFSHGRNRSQRVISEQRRYAQRNPGKKLPIKRYKKKHPNEVLLVGFPNGRGGFRYFDISQDSKRKDKLRGILDKYIKEELDSRNIDLEARGRNEIDYFLECIYKILNIKERLST